MVVTAGSAPTPAGRGLGVADPAGGAGDDRGRTADPRRPRRHRAGAAADDHRRRRTARGARPRPPAYRRASASPVSRSPPGPAPARAEPLPARPPTSSGNWRRSLPMSGHARAGGRDPRARSGEGAVVTRLGAPRAHVPVDERPQLPLVLRRTADLDDRHVDAVDRAGLARAPDHGSGVALGVTVALQFTPSCSSARGGLVADRADKRRLLVGRRPPPACSPWSSERSPRFGVVQLWMIFVLARSRGRERPRQPGPPRSWSRWWGPST